MSVSFRCRATSIIPLLLLACWAATTCAADPLWQYQAAVERGPDRKGKPQEPGAALCWLPPAAQHLRGVLIGGQLGIEGELVADPVVRTACADCGIALVYFSPHLSGTFEYWQEGNTDGARLLKALADLAARSGHPELARVPWITMGHSTAGIFCRNVAYWMPQRVAGVFSIKSGNFFQASVKPPTGSLAGIPFVALNGQLETFGPEGGIRPELGRETQWQVARSDLLRFRAADPEYLMQDLVHPGQDHFHGGPEIGAFVALWLHSLAAVRLPTELPPGDDPILALPVKAASGWLSDPDLVAPKHPPAPYADYTGDRNQAMWHLDRNVAEATAAMHRNLGNHQCLDFPVATWNDTGDGWTCTMTVQWLDHLPEKYGGALANLAVGHATTPFVFRAKVNEPVEQLGPDTFRVLRPVKNINITAWHPGDEHYRSTGRWAGITLPLPKTGTAQTITFPSPGDLAPDAAPLPLQATSSAGLPVDYQVEYGPVAVHDGVLRITDLPVAARLPIDCRITAWQIGRRIGEVVLPAKPVSVAFRIVAR